MSKHLSSSMLTWLRSFEAVVRHGSFTQAATELHITQSAVSQQIKRLEEHLGVPLLLRNSKSLSLTPEGMKLAPGLDAAFGSLRNALSELVLPGGVTAVTLSCSPSFAMTWIAPRLSRLLERQPGLNVRVFGEFHQLDKAQMARDGLEAAVRFDTGHYADMEATPFLDEYLFPVASPAFLARHPEVRLPSDLRGEMLLHDIRPWAGVGEDEEWHRWLTGAGVSLENLQLGKRFNLSQLAIGAALAGEGIAMGRLALALEYLERGLLVEPFGIAVKSVASYYFVCAKDCSSRIASLQKWLQAEGSNFARTRAPFLDRMRIEPAPQD